MTSRTRMAAIARGERCWFVPGGPQEPVDVTGHRIGVLVCEDLWDEGYAVHPPAELRAAGAELRVEYSATYHFYARR